jgi:uncharacterized membrane protein
VTDHDHPPGLRLGDEAPLARAAVWASVTAVALGFCFVPQLLGLALAGLSLAREPAGRKHAWLAIVLSLVLTVVWGVVLGLLVKWWAASQTGT